MTRFSLVCLRWMMVLLQSYTKAESCENERYNLSSFQGTPLASGDLG